MFYLHLVGDSQFCRYYQYCQRISTNKYYNFKIQDKLVKSGSTVHDIKSMLKQTPPFQLKSNIVLFIGTNDVLRRVALHIFKAQYLSLIRLIKNKFQPANLILVMLPPFPKLLLDSTSLTIIDSINTFISTLHTNNVHILRLPITTENAEIYFHRYYHNSNRRDGIHLNDFGFNQLSIRLVDILQECA